MEKIKPSDTGILVGRSPFYEDNQLKRYSADDPTIYVERYSTIGAADFQKYAAAGEAAFQQYLDTYSTMRAKLLSLGLDGYVPELIDFGIDDAAGGAAWASYGLPTESCYSLREVLNSHEDGLDGRDWGWMANRILAVLAESSRSAVVDLDNVLVDPEGHGVVLLGWRPVSAATSPIAGLYETMKIVLAEGEDRGVQLNFMEEACQDFARNRRGYTDSGVVDYDAFYYTYQDAARDYKAVLRNLYGKPQFRQFSVDSSKSLPFGAVR